MTILFVNALTGDRPMSPLKKINSAAVSFDSAHAKPTTVQTNEYGFKRIWDVVLAVTLLILTFPIITLIWIAVKISSSGPGFYSQIRVGLGGRHYQIYKIRTMYHNCELKFGAQWCAKKDSRVTPLGFVLRKLHLDELPQLFNVIRGDMSLVGPRPERPEFVEPLSAVIQGYTERQKVRPGVTGLAQIQLPPDTDIESVRTKLVLDRCYVEQCSFGLDLRLLLGTALYLSGFSSFNLRRITQLPNPLMEQNKVWNGYVSFEPNYKDPCSHDWQPVACGKS